ncbi:glycoside hydrolase [Exidia glandulosa HHB12029]|uniref:endo-1,4-beta-xylanase n=1 Tax=Exidia glandulosa HHB12029 TaxID=1314781 RepID=A0A165F9W2_EXIGL|nr:glycoside hydrolase [Exidia glandulosa HHB12029]
MPAVLTALLLFLVPALAQTPTPDVSLVSDLPLFSTSGPLLIRGLLPLVSLRKGAPFHFGATHDIWNPNATWTSNVFNTVFNHVVAENGCKWYDTEPVRGEANLTDCKGASQFAGAHHATFRGHNTFWHSQTPEWLPGNVTAEDLVKNVIPEHVKAEITGLGPNVTSWDVMNEIIGDTTTWDMDALACVQNKNAWPTRSVDGDATSAPLVNDLSFVHAAFAAAFKAAAPSTRLVYNEYYTGFNDSKTACVVKLIEDIHNTVKIPLNRLAVGFQSHVTAAPIVDFPRSFVPKTDLGATFKRLAGLGVDVLVTEIDIVVQTNTTADARWQAAIWGDTLDACLYASNCHEFINWDTRDDQSWIQPKPGRATLPTLFDVDGNPKLVAYELQARFARFALGRPETCATALGTTACTVFF